MYEESCLVLLHTKNCETIQTVERRDRSQAQSPSDVLDAVFDPASRSFYLNFLEAGKSEFDVMFPEAGILMSVDYG